MANVLSRSGTKPAFGEEARPVPPHRAGLFICAGLGAPRREFGDTVTAQEDSSPN